jgi:hypothetical protein
VQRVEFCPAVHRRNTGHRRPDTAYRSPYGQRSTPYGRVKFAGTHCDTYKGSDPIQTKLIMILRYCSCQTRHSYTTFSALVPFSHASYHAA